MLKMQVLGHLGTDAKLNQVEGKDVANFSVAHSWKNAAGEEKTVWVDCSLWERPKLHPYLVKGQQVLLEGAPFIRTYQAQDGTTKAVQCLTVYDFNFCGGRPGGSAAPAATGSAAGSGAAPAGGSGPGGETADDLPF